MQFLIYCCFDIENNLDKSEKKFILEAKSCIIIVKVEYAKKTYSIFGISY